jgi:hypothetical protein
MSGNRLFRPSDNLDVRSPTSNQQENGNIVNPPRFSEFGGLSSASARGLKKNDKGIRMPGSTQKKVPYSMGS